MTLDPNTVMDLNNTTSQIERLSEDYFSQKQKL